MSSHIVAESYLGSRYEEVRRWAEMDPDPESREQLLQILKSALLGDLEEVLSSFAQPLVFGTAGLRGPIGIGPGRFNVCLVARLARALVAWLEDRGLPGPVVIGFDARHKSREAAHAAAAQFAAAGLEVLVQSAPRPTPALAFAARELGASVALMVTASHNPGTDNGVKIYGPDARQIIPPVDVEIAAHLAAVDSLLPPSSTWRVLDESLFDRYVESCVSLATSPAPLRSHVVIAHTAMHGVALSALTPVFARAGFSFRTVPAQADPDPDFPTVSFPNPEEPGAMDQLLALAAEISADVAMANDPDADRLAAAVRAADGSYRVLTGDELGAVFLWARAATDRVSGTVANTIVSSELLGHVCQGYGLKYETTLTGFKWLSHVKDLGYACEESIGYCLDPDHVRDKDGISAALVLADLIAAGLDPLDVLEKLDRRYGAHVQANFSLRTSPEQTASLLESLLSGETLPTLLEAPRLSTEDLSKHPSQPTNGIRLRFKGDSFTARLLMRPSGTEPKTKVYLEVVHADRTTAISLATRARLEIETALG
jgi:phosphomannomutase